MAGNFNIVEYDLVASTMDTALELLQKGLPKDNRIKIILAKTQSAGHGRHGRMWVSPSGNLHQSLILRLDNYDPRTLYQLSFLMSVALRRVISKLVDGKEPKNKWPNDLMVDGKKLAGVILEAHPTYNAVVVGIGLNILKKPDNVMYPATSLHSYGVYLSPKTLALQIGRQFEQLLNIWEEGKFEEIVREWKQHAWGIGQEASVLYKQQVLQGTVYNIDDDGFLLLKGSSGEIHRIFAGDIIIQEKERT
jgi:BirA family transcriptional regulator, biotin operon repressor / biotin---[acetyl-CoA-carboxylase] ligase